MLQIDNIALSVSCQQYQSKSVEFDCKKSQATLCFESNQKSSEVFCPCCGGKVYIHDRKEIDLKDAPIFPGIAQKIRVTRHRYRCGCCGKTFMEDLGMLKYPGSMITRRAAMVIRQLLMFHIPESAVSSILNIRWNTVQKVHLDYMREQLKAWKEEQIRKGYRPKYLAIDEFAIHRGHTYATCVLDLDEGNVIWAGMGRTIEQFRKFFEETDPEMLSEVKAVAMDMNASYSNLVTKYLPKTAIVYDRYHMQAQFGKDVLGSVRLEEAKAHRTKALGLDQLRDDETDPAVRKELKDQARKERHEYSAIKKSRWTLLMSADRLLPERKDSLSEILRNHEKLAVCYAMKEEMCELFDMTDPEAARKGWTDWFQAAKESEVPQLVHFAELKEKRVEGLISHAMFPISTGKLEGFNNKIKVAKRVGYGFRNNDYFFTLIKYLSLPESRKRSHTFW